jgi:hypothetical protein
VSEALAHLLGDYVVQSDWMAAEKTSHHLPAAVHAATYAACFIPVTRNPRALAVIGGTHFVIDRWRLARHVVWAKNQAAPSFWRYPWSAGRRTGYYQPDTIVQHGMDPVLPPKPDWMAVWLMIIADNTMHLCINRWALNRWSD